MTDEKTAAQVAELGREAARRVSEERGRGSRDGERCPYEITKFERHPDGYPHANLLLDGKDLYVHRKFGSWMAPGTVKGTAVLMELEAFGLGIEVKEDLQAQDRSLKKREGRDDAGNSDTDNDAPTGETATPDLREGGDGSGAGGAPDELES